MAASPLPRPQARPALGSRPLPVTLLELVHTVSEYADDEQEVVATVLHMLETGRVRLCGTLRNDPPRRPLG